ncbi:hypothetical protein IscW_ISCW015810 [Ixodes scapularis]|uniref:Uncharacterized protein n=1 Tax=Ixodes scapularis TaxID=6945 RepID=B7P4E6_IXOSC|nr:hypothetical protein IscW_ISCW015810 [Ixodes scapularis]|eukprot:XP_002405912.1 hypothetical protein IscW_ISCW015810 [Ixodes scapularis]
MKAVPGAPGSEINLGVSPIVAGEWADGRRARGPRCHDRSMGLRLRAPSRSSRTPSTRSAPSPAAGFSCRPLG